MTLRVAVYTAPRAGTIWHRRASAWLGYDPVSGRTVRRTDVLPLDELTELTSAASAYGFHATLRSPFELAEYADLAEVLGAVDEAAGQVGPTTVQLEIGLLGGFAAFVPTRGADELARIERACVIALDRVVRRPDEATLARRRRGPLTERQDELLVRWGYPYVLDEFRFHMTLTRRLGDHEVDRVTPAARTHFGALDGSAYQLDELVVLTQRDARPFVELTRVPLSGSSAS